METCLVNLIEPGDKAVVCTKGFFGQRMVDVAGRGRGRGDGAGTAVGPGVRPRPDPRHAQAGAAEGARHRPRRDVHRGAGSRSSSWASCATSSTRCWSSTASRRSGCVPVKLDEWEIDAVVQLLAEGAELPAGAVAGEFSDRAVEALKARKTKVQSWYLDLSLIAELLGRRPGVPPHGADHDDLRPPRGAAARAGGGAGGAVRPARPQPQGAEGRAGRRSGLTYTAAEGHQLPQLNAVRIPDGVDDVGRPQAAARPSSASRSAAGWATSRARRGGSG